MWSASSLISGGGRRPPPPWAVPSGSAAGGRAASRRGPRPARPRGTGTPKKVRATNDATASTTRAGWPRPLRPTRTTACTTIAMTAGARPRKSDSTSVGVAEADVDPRQHQQRHHAGQDEEDAGDQRAADAVEQPPDVRRQLLGLGAGEQRAVGQREEEPLLADPPLLLDERALHDRDLAGRAAEGLQRDREPGPGRLAQRDHVPRRLLGCRHRSTEPLPDGQSQADDSTTRLVCQAARLGAGAGPGGAASSRAATARCSGSRWVRPSRSAISWMASSS